MPHKIPLLLGFLGIVSMVVGIIGLGQAQDEALPPLIFVKQTPVDFTSGMIADIFSNFGGRNPGRTQPTGGGLFRLDPDGTLTNLTPFADIAVRDPEISYDGERVIFSMKRGPLGNWQIHEMNVDGSDLRAISRDSRVNDWDPAYMPDGRILFVSDRFLRLMDLRNLSPEGQLFSMNRDGNDFQMLNSNINGSFNPLVGQNGLIYFTQWDLDQQGGPLDVSRFLLWEVFQDGSREGHPIFGSHIVDDFSGGFTEIRELPDGSGDAIAVRTAALNTWGAGSIVRFSPRGNPDQDAVNWLTTPAGFALEAENRGGRYRSPYPLADGRIVASFAPGAVWFDSEAESQTPDFDLVVLTDDGEHRVLHSDPNFWDWQAVEVAPRPAPVLAQPLSASEFDYAIINARDVSLRHRNADMVANGDTQAAIDLSEAASVRIIEFQRQPIFYAGSGNSEGPPRKPLGEVPVAEDGSFAAIVNARQMISWEVLDADGEVLVSERFWSELAPGEVRSCNGCHSPHDNRVGNTTNLALRNPTNLTQLDVDTDNDGVVDLLQVLQARQ